MKKTTWIIVLILMATSCGGNKNNQTNDNDFESDLTNDYSSSVNVTSSTSVTKNQTFIALQDFIKEQLKHPKEANFDSNIVYEPQGGDKYVVLGKVSAKNSFGVTSEYTYKIWLKFKGQEWNDKDNWIAEKIMLENNSTQEQTIIDNRVKPTNDKTVRNLEEIDNIKCSVIESNNLMARITTSKKMTESQIKKAVYTWNLSVNIHYFHLPKKTKSGEEYASKMGELILVFD